MRDDAIQLTWRVRPFLRWLQGYILQGGPSVQYLGALDLDDQITVAQKKHREKYILSPQHYSVRNHHCMYTIRLPDNLKRKGQLEEASPGGLL